MSDLTERLADALAVCDAATEGPWMRDPDDHGRILKPDDPSGFDGYQIAEVVDHDGGLFPVEINTAFIAHARTGYPAALRALQAVLELHKPRDPADDQCAGCLDIDPGGFVPWPCPTVQAITEHLEATP